MDSFKQKTTTGLSWSFKNQLFTQSTHFVFSLLLARLLAPSDFGLLAMVMVVSGFLKIFNDLALSGAVIQKPAINTTIVSTVFWIHLATGVVLSLLFLAASEWISQFYHEPNLKVIIPFIALEFIIASFSFLPMALLKKKLNFKAIFYINFSSVVLSGMAGIAMALAGYGFWSLIGKMLLWSLLQSVLAWIYCEWAPKQRPSKKAATELFAFSTPLIGTQSLDFWVRNIDDLLIGKVLGNHQLGLYSRGYALMLLPLTNISKVFSDVLFPALSIVQEDKERVKKVYLKTSRVVGLITFPLMTGLLVLAEPFILLVLGEQWRGTIPVVKVLSVLGLFQSIGVLTGHIFLSQGATKLQLKIGVFTKLFMVAMILFGVYYTKSIVGVALFYTAASLLVLLPEWYFMGGLIQLRINTIVANLAGVFASASTMGLLLWGLKYGLPDVPWNIFTLLFFIFLGAVIYWGIIVLFKVKAYQEAKAELLQIIR